MHSLDSREREGCGYASISMKATLRALGLGALFLGCGDNGSSATGQVSPRAPYPGVPGVS